jgi:hypothetical protein
MTTKNWITGQVFIPEVGKFYEVTFGEVTFQGKKGIGTARIRVDGTDPSQWFDIDDQCKLPPELARYVVQGYRQLTVSTWAVIHDVNRSPTPFAAHRFSNGQINGYALDGMTYEMVYKQLPPGGVMRKRSDTDHPSILAFWDCWI